MKVLSDFETEMTHFGTLLFSVSRSTEGSGDDSLSKPPIVITVGKLKEV